MLLVFVAIFFFSLINQNQQDKKISICPPNSNEQQEWYLLLRPANQQYEDIEKENKQKADEILDLKLKVQSELWITPFTGGSFTVG